MLTLKESKRRLSLVNEIKDAENEVERLQHEYLKSCGWTYTSDTPGCLWLWVKAAPKSRRNGRPDGAVMMVNTDIALHMQRDDDATEMPDEAFTEVE